MRVLAYSSPQIFIISSGSTERLLFEKSTAVDGRWPTVPEDTGAHSSAYLYL